MKHKIFTNKSRKIMAMGGVLTALVYPMGEAYAAEEKKGALEEIVITAQKREQSLQDVSTAVTAMTSDRLQDAGVSDITSLQFYSPSLTIGTTFGYANLFMRGLGLNTAFANVDPSVTLYVDGAVISQPSAQLFSFFDLERVEVLRGPQGTLYGRNATGGTINLLAKKPTDEQEGFFRVTGGDYNLFQTEGGIGGPLTERLSARFAFQTIDRNGYGINEVTGNDIDDSNRKAFRGQLLYRASDTVDVLLAAEYGVENDASNAFLFKRKTFPGSTLPQAIAPGDGGFAVGERNFASNIDPENDRETFSITGTVDWEINEKLSFKNIMNYRKTDIANYQDLDASSIVNSSIQEFTFDSEQFSEEMQFVYTDDRFRAIAGFYYFKEDLFHTNKVDTLKLGGSFTSVAGDTEKRVDLSGTGQTRSWALFWNASFDVTEKITLKGGGRYTKDTRNISNDNIIWVAGGAVRLDAVFTDEETFTDYNNEVGIEWRPNDDMMLYYTFSEGFKAGSGQLSSGILNPVTGANIIDPETIINHEVGLKSMWLESSLMLNLAAYYYKVDGIQLDRTIPGGPTGFMNVFENATTQKAKGVELEATWAATDQLRFSATVAYQDTEFGSFTTADPTNVLNLTGVDNVDILGNQARQAPKWAWNLHGDYLFPLSNDGTLTLSGDVSYKGDHFFSEFNNNILHQGAYTLFDARIRYTSPSEQWSVELWGKNLSNELVESGNFALATGRIIVKTLLPPRTWGIIAGYKF